MRLAVVGANGFIGSRTVEILHLAGLASVRPVVRELAGLAGLSRFELDYRIADARDADALHEALSGCDVVLHAVAGDPACIVSTASTVYRAAEAAGARRLVYLSSASVHGQAPRPGTDERSPLPVRHPLAYNRAKASAERLLRRLRARGTVELVILRPGIVYGPRSQWTVGIADALLAGRAYLVDGGAGVCNCVYVDNLVHAIYLAAVTPAADGEAFLIGEREQTTWRDFYRALAEPLGLDVEALPCVDAVRRGPSLAERVEQVLASEMAQMLLSRFSPGLRSRARSYVPGLRDVEPASAWHRPAQRPDATKEMLLLQRCRYRLSYRKAASVLGYAPLLSFAEGSRRTLHWLAFAGYPVEGRGIREEHAVSAGAEGSR